MIKKYLTFCFVLDCLVCLVEGTVGAEVGLLEALCVLLALVLVGAAVGLLEVLFVLLALVEDLVCLVETGLLFVVLATLFGWKKNDDHKIGSTAVRMISIGLWCQYDFSVTVCAMCVRAGTFVLCLRLCSVGLDCLDCASCAYSKICIDVTSCCRPRLNAPHTAKTDQLTHPLYLSQSQYMYKALTACLSFMWEIHRLQAQLLIAPRLKLQL